MAAAGGKAKMGPPRFVYVTRFSSHQCGSVLQLGGRRTERFWSPRFESGGSQKEPRGAATGAPGGRELSPGTEPRAPGASSAERASSARSGKRSAAARAGLPQKTVAKKFDFPIPSNEASKIMKKKKKVSVWKTVHKVNSRMLEENEKYRLRLKRQLLSSENSDYTR